MPSPTWLAVNLLRGNDAYTGSGYGAKHQQGGSTQDGVRHQREHQPDSREQAQYNQETGNVITDVTACYAVS